MIPYVAGCHIKHCERLEPIGSFFNKRNFQYVQEDSPHRLASLALTRSRLLYNKRRHFSWIISTRIGIFIEQVGYSFLLSLANNLIRLLSAQHCRRLALAMKPARLRLLSKHPGRSHEPKHSLLTQGVITLDTLERHEYVSCDMRIFWHLEPQHRLKTLRLQLRLWR